MKWKEGFMAASELLRHTLRAATERNHEKLSVLSMCRKRTKLEETYWLLERYIQ